MSRKFPCVDPPPADPRTRRQYWRELPEHGPLVGIRGGWGLHITDHEAIMDAFADPEVWRPGIGDIDQLANDPVQRQQYRAELRHILTRPEIPELRAQAREIVEAVAPQGCCEVHALATEYASRALWSVLGWPPETRPLLIDAWTLPGLGRFAPQVQTAITACARRLRELTDIPSADARRIVATLVNAGVRTTASAITFGLLEIARNPQLRAHLRPGFLGLHLKTQVGGHLRDHPEDIGPFCHEALRLDPPIPAVIRNPSRQVHMDGVAIPAGTEVRLPIATLNTRDGADVAIEDGKICPRKHFTFGYNARRCVGAELGALEVRLMIGEFVTAIPEFELAARYEEPAPQRGDPLSREAGQVHLRWNT